MDQLLTYKTAAAILDCSASKVKKMVLAGELACIKLGNETRIRESTLQAWMDAGEHFHQAQKRSENCRDSKHSEVHPTGERFEASR